ncbi:hypothetical protein GCM10009827_120030 [Dactylosporangium maewongense]|uniref:Uncharacterized protein n=1 Tax=Dactylosporangium maewongense TaxID=634393 RepID=A0ABN2DJJ7_9ACTN
MRSTEVAHDAVETLGTPQEFGRGGAVRPRVEGCVLVHLRLVDTYLTDAVRLAPKSAAIVERRLLFAPVSE